MLDLDSLENPKKSIKLQGKEAELRYPSLRQLAKLLALAEKMKTENEKEISEAILGLNDLFKELIPDLGDYELNLNQIYALIQVFSDMSTPDEMKSINTTDTKKN